MWVSTCQAVNGARPAASSSGSQRASGAVSAKVPSWTSRMTAVATIGLVIDASRQTALVPIRGPSPVGTRPAGDALGAGNGEDRERDDARLHLAGGEGEGGVEGVGGHRQNDTPAGGACGLPATAPRGQVRATVAVSKIGYRAGTGFVAAR